jgi:hypothetical protein
MKDFCMGRREIDLVSLIYGHGDTVGNVLFSFIFIVINNVILLILT